MAPTDRPFAVVTGASSGIGLELARLFAQRGYDLLVAAENDDITAVAKELGAGPASARAAQVDLRTRRGVDELYTAIRADGRAVAALALNAGVGAGNAFVDQSVADVLSVVELNVLGTTHLARLVLPDMVAHGSGRVLITSSIASMMPGPYQATYNASKSYLQSLAQALQFELRGSGVTVTSLMPGPTATAFFERAGMAADTVMGRSGMKDDPAQVAEQGYDAMMHGRARVVGGSTATRLQYWSGIVLPDRAKAAMHTVIAKPRGR